MTKVNQKKLAGIKNNNSNTKLSKKYGTFDMRYKGELALGGKHAD